MAKKKPRIGLPVVPPRGSPFTGISKTNAPARNTKTPNLTAKVTLAKTRREALTHGGLLTPAQQKAASDAGKALAAHKQAKKAATRTPQTASKPLAKKPPSDSTPPLILGAPAPPPSAPAPARPVPSLPTGRRGTTNPRLQMQQAQPAQSSLGSLLGKAGNAASVGLGTALSVAESVPRELITPLHPGATVNTPVESVKPTHLGKATADIAARSSGIAAGVQGLGLKLPKTIPSVDVVPAAGAASRTAYTPQELVAAGLTPAQTKKFRDMAINKRHWYPGEIDGLVGLDLIKHAYSSPPPLPLRILQNAGAGVIRTAGLANLPVAAAQEISSGHGMRFAKDIGNALTHQGSEILSNPGQAFVSDPYGTVPIAGGALKTLGGIGGKLAEKAGRQAVERSVTHAVTGAAIPRGLRDRNLYTATGQSISDLATSKSAILSKRANAQSVDKLVSDIQNETAPAHHAVQVPYHKAFGGVRAKRAAVLASINAAGGKPEKILAFYQRSGNKRQVAHWTKVVEAQKNLSAKDHAFLAAHREIGAQTTGANIEAERFGETAGIYRAHQPLILSDAHAGDPSAQRVQALHDEWITTLRKTDDPAVLAPLHGAYDHAVREYAQSHLDAGGTEPTRVAYTKPPATGVMQPQYRKGTGGRARFNPNYPKQKASTGGSFESGNYLIDPKVAMQENLQAQRIRTSIGLSSDESYAKVGGIAAEKGDPRPEGYVFTPRRNAATVGKVVTDLQDHPVGAHDYYHQEAGVRDRLAKHLETTKNAGLRKDSTGEYAGEKGWFIPEGSFNRILDYTRPESRSAYDKFMRQYQRTMISIFPSTVLGNTVGSIPLALAAGAGGKSFNKARESSSLGGDISLVPHSLHGRGVAGNLAADARNPLTVGMNKMRRANVIGEDFSRDAAYFSKALRGAKGRAKELDYPDTNAYLRDMASGKVDPHVRDAAIAHAIKFAGDAAKPMTKTTQKLSKVVLFPAWLQHMTKLMLVTLPLHHPRRMALINALALYGDQYRKEHGVLPSWMQSMAPLFAHVEGANTFTRAVGLGQLAPQGTAGGTFDTLLQSQSLPQRVVNLMNPPVAAVANSILQTAANPSATYPVNLPRYFANQLAYTVPGMSKFAPRTGMTSESIPFISPQRIPYTTGAKKNKWSPNANVLPWDQRPGARPLGGVLGDLSRVFGLPLYDIPSKGPINAATVAKQIKKSAPKAKGWGS